MAGIDQPAASLGASEYLREVHGRVAGRPAIDLALEARVQRVLVEAAEYGLLRSAHDCSHGGLSVALAEACLAKGVGFASQAVRLRGRRDAALFGEKASRVVVSLLEEAVGELEALLNRVEVPYVRIGRTGGERLRLVTSIDVSLIDLGRAYDSGLESALSEAERSGA